MTTAMTVCGIIVALIATAIVAAIATSPLFNNRSDLDAANGVEDEDAAERATREYGPLK